MSQTQSVPSSAEGVLLPAPSCTSLTSIALNSGEYHEPIQVIQGKYLAYVVLSEPTGFKRGGGCLQKIQPEIRL